MESTSALRERLGFKDSTRWKQFCARRLHLIHNLSLNLRKASEQEEQVRALASELCAEYGFTARAKPDFEKLLIAGIQSVRRNQKRSGRQLSMVPTYDLAVKMDSNVVHEKSVSPSVHRASYSRGVGHPSKIQASKPPVVSLSQSFSSESPLTQSLAARIDVLRELVTSSGSRVTLDSNVVIQSNAQSILTIAVSTAVMHAKLPETGALALQSQVNCGMLVRALCDTVDPEMGSQRFLDCIGTLAASLVHGPLLLGALQALFVCLSQISEASVPRMIDILEKCSLAKNGLQHSDIGETSPGRNSDQTSPDSHNSQTSHQNTTTSPIQHASVEQKSQIEIQHPQIQGFPPTHTPPAIMPTTPIHSIPFSSASRSSSRNDSLDPILNGKQRNLVSQPSSSDIMEVTPTPNLIPTQHSPHNLQLQPQPPLQLQPQPPLQLQPQLQPPQPGAPQTGPEQPSLTGNQVPSIYSLAVPQVLSVAGPDRQVTLKFNDKSLKLTYSPLKATPPTVGEIIDNARQSFDIPESTVVRIKDARTSKIIESNSELIDSFSMPEVQLELIVPPPMLIDSLKMVRKPDIKFTPLAPIMFKDKN